MKQKIIVVALLIAVVATILIIYVKSPGAQVDAPKIFAAAQNYTRDLKRQGVAIPDSVNLKELIARGFLQSSDVAGFVGSDVTVALTANPNDHRVVLLRARFPDGQELLTMGDGSIQVKQTKP